jgi:hypothetical protein
MKIIAIIAIMICTGCRIVNTKIIIEKTTDSTISIDAMQEQRAEKEIGDIAPKATIMP